MGNDQSDKKPSSSKLPDKLTALLGGGLAILNGALVVNSAEDIKSAVQNGTTEIINSVRTRTLPPKLTIKQFSTGYTLIAQHASHSSHDSHASHDSHSSHSSHDSHASHASHSSHSSHVSGGWV
jgi:hypothetical protein